MKYFFLFLYLSALHIAVVREQSTHSSFEVRVNQMKWTKVFFSMVVMTLFISFGSSIS